MTERVKADQVDFKRAYEPVALNSPTWISIGRPWRRGIRKADAGIDQSVKDIASSTALRKWFGHDSGFLEEFRHRYAPEVVSHPEPLGRLWVLARQGSFSTCGQFRDAVVTLRNFLLRRKLKRKAKANHQ
jgi:uncharacterized protein YeaO (DUF488 family)